MPYSNGRRCFMTASFGLNSPSNHRFRRSFGYLEGFPSECRSTWRQHKKWSQWSLTGQIIWSNIFNLSCWVEMKSKTAAFNCRRTDARDYQETTTGTSPSQEEWRNPNGEQNDPWPQYRRKDWRRDSCNRWEQTWVRNTSRVCVCQVIDMRANANCQHPLEEWRQMQKNNKSTWLLLWLPVLTINWVLLTCRVQSPSPWCECWRA